MPDIIKQVSIKLPDGSIDTRFVGADAINVDYDNTDSGLAAINIQNAIDELANGGLSGGHTIQNPSGIDLNQEDTLQFIDAGITDDSTNGKTKVEIVRQITSSQLSSLTEDGIYETTDESNDPLDAGLVGYDNTSSGLTSDDVQDAIDELAKPTFAEASTRANIASGDTLSTILGKIKKFFTDLKTVAFTGAYSDLTGTENVAYKNINNNFSAHQVFNTANGTTSSAGFTDIYIGNSTPVGTDGNSRGRLLIYGNSSNYAILQASNVSSSNKTLELPDASGTLALTSDLPTKLARTLLVSKTGIGTWTVDINVSAYSFILLELTWYDAPFATLLCFVRQTTPRVSGCVDAASNWGWGNCEINASKHITKMQTFGEGAVTGSAFAFKIYGLSLSV